MNSAVYSSQENGQNKIFKYYDPSTPPTRKSTKIIQEKSLKFLHEELESQIHQRA